MTTTIAASFETRQAADMAVEHLTQELGIDAKAVTVAAAEGSSSGTRPTGGDLEPGSTGEPELSSSIIVSVEAPAEQTDQVQAALTTYGGDRVPDH